MGNHFIPLSVPNLAGNELQYVTQAVKTGWVSTAGNYVTDFEKSIADYVGTIGAAACQSGTAGLHIALLLCGVTREDLVIVPALTFIAAVNPVRYLGAEPVFMDCDDSLCIDPKKLEAFCKDECELRNNTLYHIDTGRRISAIVIVHVFGNMADMESLLKIASTYNLKAIEDATEALGTKFTKGLFAGRFAGTMGDIGVYSFNGNKIITSGGGGMIVSDNEDYLKHAKHLTTQAKSDELNFQHDEVGYNYRLTNLQAALGLAQLEQLENFISVKQRNYEFYKNNIQNISGLSLLNFRPGTRSNHWFYSLYCDERYPLNRDEIIRCLSEKGIQSRPIWGLIHEQAPYINSLAYHIERAQVFQENVVNIPCSTNLSENDAAYVVECLKAAN